MPIYSFRNNKTGEEFTEMMKISELEKFLKKNKDIEQILIKVNMGDPWLLEGVKKVPSDFSKYILGRVKEKVPGAEIERGRYHVQKEI